MIRLDATQRIRFPDPSRANEWGVVAQGGNLSPGILLSAYEQGIFPWYEEEPITWFSPDPRFVLYLQEFHVPRRLKRDIAGGSLRVVFDADFAAVIRSCRIADRRGPAGTWITAEMEAAYTELHRLGYTHSVEVYRDAELVGGLYGVAVGDLFAGESMFSSGGGESKWALVALAGFIDSLGLPMIDSQSYTTHLATFGARDIPREEYLTALATLRGGNSIPRDWRDINGEEMLARGISRADRGQ